MCGILAFSGRFPADESLVRGLFRENEDRGIHSTGLFAVGSDKGKTQLLLKKADRATDFIRKPDFARTLHGATSLIGHTRAATWGVIKDENAHPFVYKPEQDDFYKTKVVGVHNGFVIEEIKHWEKMGFKYPFDVDSMLIFAALAKNGGDYNVLSQIEGAVTIAYMVPDKYPDVVFLYRRTARELHFGMKKEGIYVSSERKPLEMYGCTQITLIPDSNLLMLKNGEILDLIELEAPKIKGLPLGAQRLTWKDKYYPIADYEFYEELKPKPNPIYTNYTPNHSNVPMGYKVGSSTVKHNTGFDPDVGEVIQSLIKDVMKDCKHFVVVEPKNYMDSYVYDNGDMDCSILIVKLVNSANKNSPLMGMVVWDKEAKENGGATSPIGVTALKFRPYECNKDRTIMMADPIDGNSVFEYTFKPEKGSVVEVTLQLPFPQEVETQPTGSANSSSEDDKQILAEKGRAELCLLPSIVKRNGRILSDSPTSSSGSIPEEKAEVDTRTEDGHFLGEEDGCSASGISGTDLQRSPGSNTTDGEATGVREIPERIASHRLAKGELQAILYRKGNQDFSCAALKNLSKTPEYAGLYTVLAQYFAEYVMFARLLRDACIIKQDLLDKKKPNYSVGFYAMLLLEYFLEDYSTRKAIESDRRKIVIDLIAQYRTGKLLKSKKNLKPDLTWMGLTTSH